MRLTIAILFVLSFVSCYCPQCNNKNRPHYDKPCSIKLQETWRNAFYKVDKVSVTLNPNDFRLAIDACDKLFNLPDLEPCQIGRGGQPCWVSVDEILADCKKLDILKDQIKD